MMPTEAYSAFYDSNNMWRDTSHQGAIYSARHDVLSLRFASLAEQWRRETGHLSSSSKKLGHPAYLKIIGMGRAVIPLILGELDRNGGHWFLALRSITGAEDMVPPNGAGDIRAMRESWLAWGRSEGFI